MYDGQEELDNLVWDKNDEDAEEGQNLLRLKHTCRRVERLAEQRFGGKKATLIPPLISGGFNILYRLRLPDVSPDVMVRLPCPGLVPFSREKTAQEVATAMFLARETGIPIPKHHFHGRDPDLGPYIIMDRVENKGTMSARLTRPSEDPSAPHVLDADIGHPVLEAIWGRAAAHLLQLSRPSFPRIGSLLETASGGTYEVAARPVTHNMADMVRLANVPREILPPEGRTYETADEWYAELADMHMAQLVFQHNDLVTSEDDCRNKYVARQIFRRLARQGKLSTFGFQQDDWLWGDDLRAGNILLTDSDDIAALIDWEFTYAGPTQFSLDPPWWLLIETAEMWSSGMDDWIDTYAVRLQTWLSAMEKAEASATEPTSFPAPLSRYMRESWETGRFFLSYGARKSWAFDAMYWKFLDQRFFGHRESSVTKDHLWKTRLDLLSHQEKAAMESFVKRKMIESKERRIVDWDPSEARRRFSEHLFD